MGGNLSLHKAALLGNLDTVKHLIETLNSDVNVRDENGETPLHFACKSGKPNCVELLVAKGADINAVNNAGMCALHFAAITAGVGGTAIIKYLVGKKKLDVNKCTKKGLTPLHMAAACGELELCKVLVDLGADRAPRDKNGTSCLHFAALENHVHILEYFIKDLGQDPDKCRNECGATALHCACECGILDSVKFLVESGSSSSLVDNEGRFALSLAVAFEKTDIVKYLVEEGEVNVNQRSAPEGMSSLHLAVCRGNYEIVKLLVNNGADCNALDEIDGRTPCHYAAEKGYAKIIKFLVEHGKADVNKRSNCGMTPLHIAATYIKDVNFLKVLIDQGADYTAQDVMGYTPLVYAGMFGHLNTVKFLIGEKQVDPNKCSKNGNTLLLSVISARSVTETKLQRTNVVQLIEYLVKERKVELNEVTNEGRTALHWACMYRDLEIVKLLLDGGADCNRCDKKGNSLLHVAAQYGKLDIVKYLIEEANAEVNKCNAAGEKPIHTALLSGKADCVQLLLAKGGQF